VPKFIIISINTQCPPPASMLRFTSNMKKTQVLNELVPAQPKE
jgi:hypothetical protein